MHGALLLLARSAILHFMCFSTAEAYTPTLACGLSVDLRTPCRADWNSLLLGWGGSPAAPLRKAGGSAAPLVAAAAKDMPAAGLGTPGPTSDTVAAAAAAAAFWAAPSCALRCWALLSSTCMS